MNRRRGTSNARPVEKPILQAAAWTALVFAAGFLALQTDPVIPLFSGVAQALAFSAEPLLRLFGYAIVRSGSELRDTLSGHAIAVSSACDGSGLLLSAAAALTWFRMRGAQMRTWPYVIGLLLAGVFAFNLVRVLVIFILIGTPEMMQTIHLYVAPLLSAVLVGCIVLHACKLDCPLASRLLILWALIAIAGAVVWNFLGQVVTCATVLPIANLLISLLPDLLVEGLSCAESGATIITTGVVSMKPPSVLNTPFYPTDFTLALPLVVASIASLRDINQIIWGAISAVGLFALAMAIAALTVGHDQAVASGITRLMGPRFNVPFEQPASVAMALLKTLQNTIVHFNLFLLPLILLGLDRSALTTSRKPPKRSNA